MRRIGKLCLDVHQETVMKTVMNIVMNSVMDDKLCHIGDFSGDLFQGECDKLRGRDGDTTEAHGMPNAASAVLQEEHIQASPYRQ